MAQRLVSTVWDEGAQTISFNWFGGKDAKPIPMTAPDGTPVVLDFNKVPDEMKISCMLHGGQQKTCDGFSDAEKISGGDPAKKRDYIVSVLTGAISNLYAGTWSERGGEGTTRLPAITIEALARATNKPLEVIKKLWADTWTDEQKAGFRKLPAVMAAMDAIRAERAATKKPAVAPAVAVAAFEELLK